jgi:streptogramin lyase
VVEQDGSAFYFDSGTSGYGVTTGLVTSDGRIYEQNLPTKIEIESAVIGRDRKIWATGPIHSAEWPPSFQSAVARVFPHAVVISTILAKSLGITEALTIGRDGSLWYALPDFNAIGESKVSGAVHVIKVPKPLKPDSLAFDSSGTLFASSSGSPSLIRISERGEISILKVPTVGAIVGSVAAGVGSIWFTDIGLGRIGLVRETGKIEEFPAPLGIHMESPVAVDRDSVWYTSPGQLHRFSIETHATVTLPVDAQSVSAIAVSGAGSIWFAVSKRSDEWACKSTCGAIIRVDP